MANRNALSKKRYWTLSPLLRALYLLLSAPALVYTSFSKIYTRTMTYASGLSCFPMSDSSFIRCYRSQTTWVWLEAKLVELGMIGATRAYEVISIHSVTFIT